MAYVAPGVTTNLKKYLKNRFPEIKLSVTRAHYCSTINVVIKAAPYNWPSGKSFVPHWYTDTKLDNQHILEEIYHEMNIGNHDDSDRLSILNTILRYKNER